MIRAAILHNPAWYAHRAAPRVTTMVKLVSTPPMHGDQTFGPFERVVMDIFRLEGVSGLTHTLLATFDPSLALWRTNQGDYDFVEIKGT